MKINLIESTRYIEGGTLLKSDHMYYPSLTFPLLAALTPPEYEVSITHEIFENIDFEADVDIVGITSITTNVYRAYEIADTFRKRGKYVVMGGVHASMLPEEALEHVDTVIVGEAEDTWPRFLEDFKTSRPQKIYRPKKPPTLINLPLPRWDLIDLNRYLCFEVFHKLRMKGAYPVQASRGCKFTCDYCSTRMFTGGGGFRPRPIKDVINEIKALKAKRIFFMDDNIFADFEWSKELFQALIPLNIDWGGQGVINAGEDEEMVKLARHSGCYFIVAGLESITPQVLESIGRSNNKVGQYVQNIRTFRKHKIDLDVSMMFGFDDDESSVFKDACDFLIDNKAPYVSWLPLTPFPGTVFYKRLEREGRLKYEKWWMRLNPDTQQKIYGLLYTGTKMNDQDFCNNLYSQYRRFYSVKNVLKRLAWPPSIRGLVTMFINFSIGRKISTQATVVEH